MGGVQGPPKYIPSKKIKIIKGAPWSPPSIKKIFIFNKKGPFLCYKIFPLNPLKRKKNCVNKLWDLLSSIKEGFWLQGHIFFVQGGPGGAPEKIYTFEGIKIFGGHFQAPPFTKSWFNQPILSISEFVKSLKLVCLIFFSLRGSFGAPENF